MRLPESLRALELSPTTTAVLAVVSCALFVATIVLIPWLLVRLPTDYFVRPPPRHSVPVRVLRNLAGVVLVALGILMLVLPGQGMLTLMIGLSVLDTPLKRRMLRRILCQHNVRSAVQALRARAHRPPLLVPDGAPS